MDLHQFLSSFSITFIPLSFLLFTTLKILFRAQNRTTTKNNNLPPGPWNLPLLGSLHHLVGYNNPPYYLLRDLAKKHGPLMHIKLGERSTMVVSSPEVAKQVLKTHDVIFADRPHYLSAEILLYNRTDMGFAPYGQYWRNLRKICSLQLLSLKKVRSYQSIREAEVAKFVRDISTNSLCAINLSEKIYSLMMGITAKAVLGDECKDEDEFVSIVKEILKVAGGLGISDLFPTRKWLHVIAGERRRFKRLHQRCEVVLERIVEVAMNKDEDEAETETEGLLYTLLKMRNESGSAEFGFSIHNVKAVILDMFVGGIETSVSLLQYAMLELLQNPTLLKRAQDEVRQSFNNEKDINFDNLKFLKAVMKETMRLHPPLPLLIPRENSEMCEINGYTVPPKTQILVNAWAIGRDPNLWNNAEDFQPERFLNSSIDYKGFNFEFIPFGAGKRICPGMAFGVADVELPLAHLLYHFDWELFSGSVRQKDLFVISFPYHHK